jgi:3-hydroxyisobutyrate dehydrogenase-like beta-hydroxyacid dehydrogenase
MDVAFCGLGIMGSRMAANLRDAGHTLTVWNRTRAKAEAMTGVTVADTPEEAAARADVLITMLVDGPHVEDVLGRAAAGARPGALFVDMTTIAPTVARRVGARLEERGIAFLDAPVTGSSPKAEAGTLTIMVGGSTADLERARPLLDVLGALVVHVGEVGQGQMLKLINNATAAANLIALGEALLVAKATGVDLDALERVMAAGSGGSAMLTLKAAPMRAHDFSTLFKLEHMLKDVRLCLEESHAAGVPFPAAGEASEILGAAAGRGLGQADFAAVIEVLEGNAGVRL